MEWQPIKTAPKSGKAIDIWSSEYGRLTNYKRVSLPDSDIFYDPVADGVNCIIDATHWMPIPKNPDI